MTMKYENGRSKGLRTVLCILLACVIAVTMSPLTANAAVYTHTFYYYDGGYWMFTPSAQKVKDNATFKISTSRPQYLADDHYRFKGYNVYRMKDKKWYVAGKGWTSSKGNAKLYQPGQTIKLDSSWTKGCKNSNYKFYAQWTHVHKVNFLYSNGNIISGRQQNVANNEYIKINFRLNKNGYTFLGWYAKRIDRNGVKWYVAGHGWCDQNTITRNHLKKKLYLYNCSYQLNSSWTNGSNGWADYKFTPVFNSGLD